MKESQLRKIAPHLITDTGVWRLTVEIGDHEMQAWIRRNDDASEPVYYLAGETWTGEVSLRNVENAVYDNPLVLDDFEADIIINTSKFMFLPAEMSCDTVMCRNAYKMVFGEAEDDEIFIDELGEYATVYMHIPGLRPFLGRSFAGARISAHISHLIKYWQSLAPTGNSLFAEIGEESIDIATFADGRLLTAVRQKWSAPDDILYFITNTTRAFTGDVDTKAVNLYISGDKENVCSLLAPYMLSINPTPVPSGEPLPLAALLCSYRKSIKQ